MVSIITDGRLVGQSGAASAAATATIELMFSCWVWKLVVVNRLHSTHSRLAIMLVVGDGAQVTEMRWHFNKSEGDNAVSSLSPGSGVKVLGGVQVRTKVPAMGEVVFISQVFCCKHHIMMIDMDSGILLQFIVKHVICDKNVV